MGSGFLFVANYRLAELHLQVSAGSRGRESEREPSLGLNTVELGDFGGVTHC